MATPEEIPEDSPVDFPSAVAYALHPEMRRLIILYVAGALLLPVGLSAFLDATPFSLFLGVVRRVVGLAISVLGATLLFGGLVGAAFKLVTDANILAAKQ